MQHEPCLMFNNYALRPTDGGPSGFLAQNLLGHESPYYRLGKAHGEPPSSLLRQLRHGYLGYNRVQMLKKLGLTSESHWAWWLLCARHTFKQEDASKFPFVWFHDVWTAAACLDLLLPNQKVILQSHCPELPSEEAACLNIKSVDVEWTRLAQQRAFHRADFVVFPTAGASSIYKSLLKDDAKLKYLLSGCQALKQCCQLPFDQQYVYYLYLGRRNAVKGFDIIVDAFKQAHQQDSSLRLIVVGGGEMVEHPGIIDIGRSEDPSMWVSNCDYFINANRQSYFDLSVMEALSLGTPLIMASTSGHQFYAELSSPGITTFPNAESYSLTKAILLNRTKRANNAAASAANKLLFDRHFSSEKYRERLNEMLRSIV